MDVFAALFVLGNPSYLHTDKIPGAIPFPVSRWQRWSRNGMHMEVGSPWNTDLGGHFVVHTMLGPTPLSFALPWHREICFS